MAKLSAHGETVGTIFFTTTAKRYMSDGHVLKNSGFGWKLYRKLKPGIEPQTAYAAQLEKQKEAMAQRPANAAYRKELHDICGLDKRWKLHSTIGMMPDDYDGVWSMCCDGYGDNVSADIDEIVALCILYRAATLEAKALQTTETEG